MGKHQFVLTVMMNCEMGNVFLRQLFRFNFWIVKTRRQTFSWLRKNGRIKNKKGSLWWSSFRCSWVVFSPPFNYLSGVEAEMRAWRCASARDDEGTSARTGSGLVCVCWSFRSVWRSPPSVLLFTLPSFSEDPPTPCSALSPLETDGHVRFRAGKTAETLQSWKEKCF